MTKEQEFGLPKGWKIIDYSNGGKPVRMYYKDLHLTVFKFAGFGWSAWAWNAGINGEDVHGDLPDPLPDEENPYAVLCYGAMCGLQSMANRLIIKVEEALKSMREND